MKQKFSYLIMAFVALLLSAFARGETVLLDKEHNNGDFESDILAPWFGESDKPGTSIETGNGIAKSGNHCCRIALNGEGSGKKIARLFQNFSNVKLANGRQFVVEMDIKKVPDHNTPKIMAELVFMGDKGNPKTVALENIGTISDDWTNCTLQMVGDVPEDWSGGKMQLRLIFYVDGVIADSAQVLVDNVTFTQKDSR